ncbi:MAG: UvrD-helicase domain-containing protein [Actinomycetota bacterium]|nr:UvrD-helicase domain-containing protein [Actinomycetota bacterium]
MPEPEDRGHRARIATDVASTLFVMAGAGTGKTTSLVSRIISLVESGVPMDSIAAITFTRRAANELRVRIRGELEPKANDTEEPRSGLYRAAIEQLASASIGTIHGFAQTLLEGWGAVVGLPMVFRVLEPVASAVQLQRSWASYIEAALEEEETRILFGWLADLDGGPNHIDKPVEAIDGAAGTLSAGEEFPDHQLPSEQQVLSEVIAVAERVAPLPPAESFAALLGAGDPLAERLTELVESARTLRSQAKSGDVAGTLTALASTAARMKVGNLGTGAAWSKAGADVKATRAEVKSAREEIEDLVARLGEAVAASAGRFAAEFVATARTERIASGEVTYDDLLWAAVELLDHADAATLEEIRGRFRVILVDEFQDTDPQQVRLIRALTGVGESLVSLDGDLAPLFFVGDPRQSIYRFRGADVRSYLSAAEAVPSANRVPLVVNFRSRREITTWVNRTFGELLEQNLPISGAALVAAREPTLAGPAVRLVSPAGEVELRRSEQRMRAEAQLAAAAAQEVVEGAYEVEDKDGIRRARYGDIAILMPRRTGLKLLLTELQSRRIPYTDSNTTLIYAEPLIRDLLAVLRSAARPHDAKALFDALMAPALGVSAQDLHDFALPFGSLREAAAAARAGRHQSVPASLKEPLDLLTSLQAGRSSLDCGELTQLAIDGMRLMEWAALDEDRDSVWRRLEEVAAEARSFAVEVSPSLHSYVDFVYRIGAEDAKVTEADGADLEVDAVRIMTVHAAKGLEFPVVILTGMNGELSRAPKPPGLYRGLDGLEVDVKGDIRTRGVEAARKQEQQELREEAVRLLYVGATRARDHLVVTIPAAVEEPGPADSGADGVSAAEAKCAYQLIAARSPLAPESVVLGEPAGVVVASGVPPFEPPEPADWLARRVRLVEAATPMPLVTATALMAYLASKRGDAEVAAEYAGGAGEEGLEVGRLVHRLLAQVDLSDPEAAIASARTRLAREPAAPQVVRRAIACLGIALGAPCVRAAAQPLREFHASVRLESGAMLDAVIDLAYETPKGLRIVDYKVVTPAGMARAEERMRTYGVQGAVYQLALARAAAPLPVAGATFLFVSEEGYREIESPPAGPHELEFLIEEYLGSMRAGESGGP